MKFSEISSYYLQFPIPVFPDEVPCQVCFPITYTTIHACIPKA